MTQSCPISRYVDVYPDLYLPYFKRAATYLSLNRPSLAAQDFSKSIELNPTFTKAYEQRAKIYIKEGRFIKAASDIEHLKSKNDVTKLVSFY